MKNRFALPLFLLAVATTLLRAEDPPIETLVAQLDHDDPMVREAAKSALATKGEPALKALKEALASGGKLDAEGTGRAQRLVRELGREHRRKTLFPEDPIGKVREALGGEPATWDLSELRHPLLEDRFTRCRFYVAHPVGLETRSVLATLVVAIAEPPSILVLKHFDQFEKLVPLAGSTETEDDLLELTGLLGGLGSAMASRDESVTFEYLDPEVVTVGQGRTIRLAGSIMVEVVEKKVSIGWVKRMVGKRIR